LAKTIVKLGRLYRANRQAFDNVAGNIDFWLKTAKSGEADASDEITSLPAGREKTVGGVVIPFPPRKL
jgi:hypothetical protein